MKSILVIEKDKNIRKFLVSLLEDHTYRVKSTPNAADAIELIEKNQPDLILLDWEVNGLTGDSACWTFRRDFPDIPLILILDEADSEVLAQKFKCGADDFITNPIDKNQLLARVKTRIGAKQTIDNVFAVADLELNEDTFEVHRNGEEVKLTPQEFKLLKFLMKNKGRVLSRDLILEKVWGYQSDVETRIVDVYIGYLRDKIDDDFDKDLIKTVRGFGYTIKD
jgi:two-component system alkaline phosphatase synthesis response regulator PhoP